MFGLSWTSIKLIGYGLLAVVLIGTAWGVKAEWDSGLAAKAQVKQIAAVSQVQTRAVAKVDTAAAKAEPAAQAKIATQTRTLIKEIPHYVPPPVAGAPVPCVSWGLVRLHDAAALGVDPGSLQLPAGATDGTCSPFTDAQFVAEVAVNYGTARANAEQLDALEADVASRAQVVAAPADPPVVP